MESPMISRECHALRINAVLNDPSVLPWVALRDQPRPLDLSPLLADPRHVLLMHESGEGGLFFQWLEPSVYEVHTQFLPSTRGRAALECVEECLEWMFLRTDAMELLTRIPELNKGAKTLVQAIGGTREYAAGDFNGQAVDVYTLRYNEWLWGESGRKLEALGDKFHRDLERKLGEAGLSHTAHPACGPHDRAVGATMSMISHGMLDKGVILYNRWSRIAGYAPIGIVARAPLILDIRDALLVLDLPQFAVMARPKELPPCL
jgi:hypothetical protein